MNKAETDAAIAAFLAGGGEITRLRYADKKSVERANRRAYHRDAAINGSQKSVAFLEKEEKRESQMIFSRIEREKA
jgi:hypothetical protein